MKNIYYLLLLALAPVISFAQNGKFDVRLSYESSTCVPKKVAVLVEVKASSVNNTFAMGDATMRFDYKLSDLSNPVLKTQHNFSSAATPRDFNYQSQSISNAEAGDDGILTLNIAYVGLNDGARTVTTDWISVATIEFDLVAADNCIDLVWHDNDRTPITGMSEIITPGEQPITQAIVGEQFIDLTYCVVFPAPTASLSASPSSITEGESTTLTVLSIDAVGDWSAMLSNGSTVSNLANTVSVSPTTTTTYSITSLTDACGTNAFPTNAPEATVGVLPNEDPCQNAVLPTATLSASPNSVVQGQSTTLTVTLTGGFGTWSVTLSDGSSLSNSSSNISEFVVFPTTTTTYSITSLTDACGTNAFPTNAPEATVGVLPNEDPCQNAVLPTATLSASPNSVVQGQSTTLTVTLTGGIGTWSVTLSDGSSLSNSSSNISEFVVFPTTTTTYSITSLSDACGTNAFPTNAPEATVGILPNEDPCQNAVLPTATLSASPNSVVQGQSTTLTVTLTGGIGTWSVTLSDGSSLSNSSSNISEFVVFPTTTTTYSITSLSDACGTNAFPTNAPEATVGVLPVDSCVPQPCVPITFRIRKI